MRKYSGKFTAASGMRIAIVAGRFNSAIVENLVEGAVDALQRHGIDDENISLAWVPGSFDIPLVAKRFATTGNVDAVICLGAVIRGATAHFDYVAGQAASGISQASLDSNIPVIFGVLTTDTIEQAVERAGTKAGNKGYEAAVAAIEMVDLMQQLPVGSRTETSGTKPQSTLSPLPLR